MCLKRGKAIEIQDIEEFNKISAEIKRESVIGTGPHSVYVTFETQT
jgi:hypothetical protein